jgi:type IV secretion system protein VirB6
MPTSRGPQPLACKDTTLPPTESELPPCSNLGQSCNDGHIYSQSLFNFSGTAVLCLKETLDLVFFGQINCIPSLDNVEITNLAPFSEFQNALRLSVAAALTIYVMFFGFSIVLNYESANLEGVATFLLKFLFVAYFSVGLGPTFLNNNLEMKQNGVTDYVLPVLSQVASDFAAIVFTSGGARGLCQFDGTRYQNGYEFYAIWDAIDCRIAYYLGMGIMYDQSDIIQSLSETNSTTTGGTPINLGAPGNDGIQSLNIVGGLPFFSVMFGYLLGGNIIAFVAGIIFAIMFISMILQFLTIYLVCSITMYAMAYIAPIFVPMALFERTYSYFDAWVKVLISCALQPAIVAGFIAFMVTTYDTAIYKNCEFKRHDYTVQNVNFSTFEIQLPAGDQEECRSSLGYKLLKNYIGQGWDKILIIIFSIHFINDLSIIPDFLYIAIFTVLFYFFSKSISQFASDITSGPIMDSVTASPTKVVNNAMKAAAFAKDVAMSSRGGGKSRPGGGGSKGGGEKGSGSSGSGSGSGGSGGGAKDSISGGK